MIALSEVQASLSLFAEAIAGHPVAFDVVDTAHDCWPRHEGRSYVAGIVAVPAELDSREQFRSVVLHDLLVEAAPSTHVRQPQHALFIQVYGLVEDHRVNALTRRSYPGAAPDLDRLLASVAAAAANEQVDSLVAALRLHTLNVSLEDLGHAVPWPAPEVLVAMLSYADQVVKAGATAADTEQAAARICALIGAVHAGVGLDEVVADADDGDEEPAVEADGTTGVPLDGGIPTGFTDRPGLASGQLLSDVEDQPTATAETDDAEPASGLRLPVVAARGPADRELRTFVYDEWDYHAQRHRPAWCRVIEERLEGTDHGFITDVRVRHQMLRFRMRRSLMRLRPQDLVRVYKSDDGDELDLDAAIEAFTDRRSGAPVDDRLHIRRDRAARDVATAFLVDLSASTSSPAVPPDVPEPIPDTDPMDDPMSYGPIWGDPPAVQPVRRVIDVAKDAVALMGDALHELGDRYAIYGFSGTGRDNVEFKIGKDFDDRVSAATWGAVAAMKPLRYTRMGPAVRHATAKLAAQQARTKLLIVLSDGYPQDTDYGRDRHDRDYGVHDTGKALIDATESGIETFCVTIDPAGHDYLREMCREDRYLVIDDVEALPQELAKLYLTRLGV